MQKEPRVYQGFPRGWSARLRYLNTMSEQKSGAHQILGKQITRQHCSVTRNAPTWACMNINRPNHPRDHPENTAFDVKDRFAIINLCNAYANYFDRNKSTLDTNQTIHGQINKRAVAEAYLM